MSRIASGALVVCAALVGTIVWETRTTTDLDLGKGVARSPVASMPHTAPGPGTADVVQGWVATALERPLFRENRRPARATSEVAAKSDQPTRLTGVMTGPFGNRALFQLAGNPKPVVAQEGSQVGEFVVLSIEPGRAVVKAGGETRILQPVHSDAGSKPRR